MLRILINVDQSKFALITPDYIYDYFEPLFKKEVYSGDLHDKYILTTAILDALEKKFAGMQDSKNYFFDLYFGAV